MKNLKKYLHLEKHLVEEQNRNMRNEKLIDELNDELEFMWHKQLSKEERDQMRKLWAELRTNNE